MRCSYIGNNCYIKLAVENLYSLAKERHSRLYRAKSVYFVDTGSVRTVHSLIRQLIRIRKAEDKACIILIENNDFIASVHTADRVTTRMPVCEWIKSVYAVRPNMDDTLSACMSVLMLHRLTSAQRRFYTYLKADKTTTQIAKQLSISDKTAYAHRQAIIESFSFLSAAHLYIYIKNESRTPKDFIRFI